MAIFNLKELNPGAWFEFEENGVKPKDRAKVKIRAISDEAVNDLLEKHMEKKVEYKRKNKHGELQRFVYNDFSPEAQKAYKHDLWDHVIVAWENIFDESKKPIECNRENKVLLMSGSPEFYAFVNRCVEKLTADVEAEAKALEKN